jgi:hypothetical protein
MSGLARQNDAHTAGCTVDRSLSEGDLAGRHARQVVQRKCEVWLDFAEPRISHDSCGPGTILFGGLKQQHCTAGPRALTAKASGKGGQDRHVAIMTTKMGLSWNGRAMGAGGDFFDRQTIELRTNHHGRTRLLAVVNGGDAMPAKIGDDPIRTTRRQKRLHHASGLHLLPRQFREAVEFAPQIDEFDHVLVGEEHQKSR